MKTLWDEYASAWSTRDGKTREAILEKRLAPDVQYVDPNAETLGYARISAYMADFQRELPGRRFVISDVIAHHDRCLAHWTMQNEESKVEMEGASFAEISPDGRLRRIYGFFRSTSGGEEGVILS